jgi:hypothetical protein
LELSCFQRANEMPRENSFGSKTGFETIARTLPSRGSMTTAAPRSTLAIAVSRARWMSRSTVSVTSCPATGNFGGTSSSMLTRRPFAFTTTYSAPFSPRSTSSVTTFDPGLADEVAHLVALLEARRELAVVDLAGIAEQLGGESALGISADGRDLHVEFGEVGTGLLDARPSPCEARRGAG